MEEVMVNGKLYKNLHKKTVGKLEHIYQLAKAELQNYLLAHTTDEARAKPVFINHKAHLELKVAQLKNLIRERH